MITRIYTFPHTPINDAWNFDGRINGSPSVSYKDRIIEGKIPTGFGPNKQTTLFCDFYKNIAIDIVTETVFEYPYAVISEKTIRPIVHKKMFLLVAPPGTLAMLHSFGFKTFGDFINEDYDDIQDPCTRIEFIVNELDRISKISIDEIQQIIIKYKSTLQHNYNHYTWLCNNEIDQIVSELCST